MLYLGGEEIPVPRQTMMPMLLSCCGSSFMTRGIGLLREDYLLCKGCLAGVLYPNVQSATIVFRGNWVVHLDGSGLSGARRYTRRCHIVYGPGPGQQNSEPVLEECSRPTHSDTACKALTQLFSPVLLRCPGRIPIYCTSQDKPNNDTQDRHSSKV